MINRLSDIWHTHSGEVIPIVKMEDDHLLNTERMLLGRGAMDWSDREHLFTIHYQAIREEIDRRNLTPLEDHEDAIERQENFRPTTSISISGRVIYSEPECQNIPWSE